ncbi:hypothetical protein QMK17_22925 [Rhodococcus sp. G-MC3]|uniref:hypothetical protein n=1 Tax=Rhodococcus sp. G-MC3 TaxID=3046209 RepID=UPI0024B9A980|nr:hypothetical protein [Rhodococcus sp. G-MC3]MDJ0396176.1 hypothetical protein [Rhodococcus sp. G-MC3]
MNPPPTHPPRYSIPAAADREASKAPISTEHDALVTWTVLIAKAAALKGLDSGSKPGAPKKGFRR